MGSSEPRARRSAFELSDGNPIDIVACRHPVRAHEACNGIDGEAVGEGALDKAQPVEVLLAETAIVPTAATPSSPLQQAALNVETDVVRSYTGELRQLGKRQVRERHG